MKGLIDMQKKEGFVKPNVNQKVAQTLRDEVDQALNEQIVDVLNELGYKVSLQSTDKKLDNVMKDLQNQGMMITTEVQMVGEDLVANVQLVQNVRTIKFSKEEKR